MEELTEKIQQVEKLLEDIDKRIDKLFDLEIKMSNKIYEISESTLMDIQGKYFKFDVYNFEKLKEYLKEVLKEYFQLKNLIQDKEWEKEIKTVFLGTWGLISDAIKMAIRKELNNLRDEILRNYSSIVKEEINKLKELRSELKEIQRSLKMKISLLKNLIEKVSEKISLDKKIFNEDELLSETLATILKLHNISEKQIEKIEFHKRAFGLEFDVLMLIRNKKGQFRTIAVELKEMDIDKLVEQLERREKYVNYIYGVIRGDPVYIIRRIFEKKKQNLFINRIGLIIVYSGGVFVFSKSSFKEVKNLIYFANKEVKRDG